MLVACSGPQILGEGGALRPPINPGLVRRQLGRLGLGRASRSNRV